MSLWIGRPSFVKTIDSIYKHNDVVALRLVNRNDACTLYKAIKSKSLLYVRVYMCVRVENGCVPRAQLDHYEQSPIAFLARAKTKIRASAYMIPFNNIQWLLSRQNKRMCESRLKIQKSIDISKS